MKNLHMYGNIYRMVQKNRNFETFEGHFFEKNFFHDFFRNDPYRGNFMREIDCAHSRSVKMLPWPWFREIDVCIEAKIEKFWNFSLKIIFLGVISCGESIARIPEAWKCFPDPDSGKWVFCIEAKIWKFWIFLLKSSF